MQGFELQNGDKLRGFLLRVFAARTTMELPSEQKLTWGAVGVRHTKKLANNFLAGLCEAVPSVLQSRPG